MTHSQFKERHRPCGVTPDDYVRSEVGVSNVRGGKQRGLYLESRQ